MTTKEWLWTVALTLIGGLVVGYTVAFTTTPLVKLMGRSRERTLLKRKNDEWRRYLMIKAMRDGSTDRQFIYTFWVGIAVALTVLGCTALIIYANLKLHGVDITDWREWLALAIVGPFVFAFFIFLVVFTNARAVVQFDQYEAKVKEKYGLPDEDFTKAEQERKWYQWKS